MKHETHHVSLRRTVTPILCAALFSLLLGGTVYGDTCITCHTDEDLLEENLAEAQTKTSAMQAGSG